MIEISFAVDHVLLDKPIEHVIKMLEKVIGWGHSQDKLEHIIILEGQLQQAFNCQETLVVLLLVASIEHYVLQDCGLPPQGRRKVQWVLIEALRTVGSEVE